MKRFFGVLFLSLLLTNCDDGDLILEEINFENVAVSACSTNKILYKLNEKEALILELPEVVFPNETVTQEVAIGGKNRLLYRFYNGKVVAENICESIPPVSPIVIDQWVGSDGKIIITSTPIKKVDNTNNSTQITGYKHAILLKNVTFVKENGTQVYEELVFGNLTTTVSTLPFAFTKVCNQCTSSKQLYNFINSEALTINNIDPNLIKNEVTPLNTPRVGLIGNSSNSLTYTSYNGLLTNDYFCNTTPPLLPTENQQWKAEPGVANTSGIIEVTTTTFANGYKHTITLKKVKMTRKNDDFLLGDSFLYGELITN